MKKYTLNLVEKTDLECEKTMIVAVYEGDEKLVEEVYTSEDGQHFAWENVLDGSPDYGMQEILFGGSDSHPAWEVVLTALWGKLRGMAVDVVVDGDKVMVL